MKAEVGVWMNAETERETETRGGKEHDRARGGGVRDCRLCLVVTVRPCIQPTVRLIGLQRVRWVEGEGGARGEWRGRGLECGE